MITHLSFIKLVEQFHKLFAHPVLEAPQIPDKKRQKLRYDLIAEELEELKKAMEDDNIVEVADALADLQYVLSGTILEFGLKDKFEDLFYEVHRSNMSKAAETEEEAKASVEQYVKKFKEPHHYELIDGKYLIYRTKDNKTVKAINYSPANLKPIVFPES